MFQNISAFLIGENARVVHHNQLLSTKFGRILRYVKIMSIVHQNCQIIQPLTGKIWGRG